MNVSALICRWVGRILGSMFLLLFLIMLIADGPPNPLEITLRESAMFGALCLAQVGVIVSWWRALLGGFVILGGWVALVTLEGSLLLSSWFAVLPSAALCLVAAGVLRRLHGANQ